MKLRFLPLVSAAAMVGGLSTANAAVTIYTDRTAFETALGSFTTETFNSYAVETPFHTSPVDVGDFTLSMTAGASTTLDNVIDPPPRRTFGI